MTAAGPVTPMRAPPMSATTSAPTTALVSLRLVGRVRRERDHIESGIGREPDDEPGPQIAGEMFGVERVTPTRAADGRACGRDEPM